MKIVDLGIFRRVKKIGRGITAGYLFLKNGPLGRLPYEWCWRVIGVLCLFLILSVCGGDGYLTAESAWPRPPTAVYDPSETAEITTETPAKTPANTPLPPFEPPTEPLAETVPAWTAPVETIPAETELLTEAEASTGGGEDGSAPLLQVGRVMTTEGEDYLFEILISPVENGGLCGLLLTIHTDEGSEIYAVTCGDMCGGLNFSYIINKEKAAVLLDGPRPTAVTSTGALCYVAIRSSTGKIPKIDVKVTEYVIK